MTLTTNNQNESDEILHDEEPEAEENPSVPAESDSHAEDSVENETPSESTEASADIDDEPVTSDQASDETPDESEDTETESTVEADVEFEGDRPIVRELQYQAPRGKAAADSDEDNQDPEFHSVAEAKAVIEGFLFSVNEPLSVNKLSKLLINLHPKTVRGLLLELQWDYDNRGGALQIIEIAGGYQMSTRAFVAPWMFRMHKHKRRSAVSPATLETLAIIAYRQPITKGEIETIRGVESGAPLRTLQELSLIEASGRREVVGRPQLYITTDQFLKAFGLKSVGDLPSIAELKTRFADDTKLKAAVAQPAKEEQEQPEALEVDGTPEETPSDEQGAFEDDNSLDPIESEFDEGIENGDNADQEDSEFDEVEDELDDEDDEDFDDEESLDEIDEESDESENTDREI